jgi:serine/threonine protein kinase
MPKPSGSAPSEYARLVPEVVQPQQAQAGATFGKWRLTARLGGGGQGHVWKAVTVGSDEPAAIKVQKKLSTTALRRMRDEVAILDTHRDVRGLLPVLDSHLPAEDSGERAWFVMPIATPLAERLRSSSKPDCVAAVAEAADTLAALHARGVGHRDVKPANLLFWRDRVVVTDFGLGTFPRKEKVTGTRENIGPRLTLAPEVRRYGRKALASPADVYSLAKCLWIFLTGIEECFDGQYDPEGPLGLRMKCADLHRGDLDHALKRATAHDPGERLTMPEFAASLRAWVATEADFLARNVADWGEVLTRLFPRGTPRRAQWDTVESIIGVLTIVGSIRDVNHLFFPEGGRQRPRWSWSLGGDWLPRTRYRRAADRETPDALF